MFRSAAVVFMSLLILAGPVAAQDAREPVARTQAERNFILGQMRLFLGSVQAISSALARNDLKTVAAEATARGRRGTPLSEVPPGLKAKLPKVWVRDTAEEPFKSSVPPAKTVVAAAPLGRMLPVAPPR